MRGRKWIAVLLCGLISLQGGTALHAELLNDGKNESDIPERQELLLDEIQAGAENQTKSPENTGESTGMPEEGEALSTAGELLSAGAASEPGAETELPRVITGFGYFDIPAHYVFPGEAASVSEEDLIRLMPEGLEVYLDHEAESTWIPVSWYCITEDYGQENVYYFQYSPVWDENLYQLDPALSLWTDAPYVGVFCTDGAQAADGFVPAVTAAAPNEEAVFRYFTGTMGVNTAAACGMMANIELESAFRPNNLQNTFEKKLGFTDESYTAAVDNGSYTNFVRDSAGYGLCQWTFYTRKQALLDYKRSRGTSIGDLMMQLEFLNRELSSDYPTLKNKLKSNIPNTADGAYEAARLWCLEFEQPSNMEAHSVTRGNLAKNTYWPRYSGSSTVPGTVEPAPFVANGLAEYRLFNPNNGEHFYTGNLNERNRLLGYGWRYEGVGWYASIESAGRKMIYRLYNPRKGFEEHHYTGDRNEIRVLKSAGWNLEGAAWISETSAGIPVFRLFNPGAVTSASSHHYTTDANERSTLCGRGWRYEGIAWYGVRPQ